MSRPAGPARSNSATGRPSGPAPSRSTEPSPVTTSCRTRPAAISSPPAISTCPATSSSPSGSRRSATTPIFSTTASTIWTGWQAACRSRAHGATNISTRGSSATGRSGTGEDNSVLPVLVGDLTFQRRFTPRYLGGEGQFSFDLHRPSPVLIGHDRRQWRRRDRRPRHRPRHGRGRLAAKLGARQRHGCRRGPPS